MGSLQNQQGSPALTRRPTRKRALSLMALVANGMSVADADLTAGDVRACAVDGWHLCLLGSIGDGGDPLAVLRVGGQGERESCEYGFPRCDCALAAAREVLVLPRLVGHGGDAQDPVALVVGG